MFTSDQEKADGETLFVTVTYDHFLTESLSFVRKVAIRGGALVSKSRSDGMVTYTFTGIYDLALIDRIAQSVKG